MDLFHQQRTKLSGEHMHLRIALRSVVEHTPAPAASTMVLRMHMYGLLMLWLACCCAILCISPCRKNTVMHFADKPSLGKLIHRLRWVCAHEESYELPCRHWTNTTVSLRQRKVFNQAFHCCRTPALPKLNLTQLTQLQHLLYLCL